MDNTNKQNGASVEDNPKATTLVKKKDLSILNNAKTTTDALSKLDITTEAGMIAFENFAKQYIRSDKSGLKTVSDVLSIFCRAQDLQLPFTSCAEHIHVINGKTGIDIHLIKALLLRAACHWDCLEDYQALYEYTDGFNVFNESSLPSYCIKCKNKKEAEELAIKEENADKFCVYPVRFYKDFNGNIYREYQLTQNFQIVIAKSQVEQVVAAKKIPIYRIPSVPVDYRTTYEIHRMIGGKEMISKGTFTYSEAVTAEMFTKDTYKKYSRTMIGHRAFTLAARDIASDLLFGVMETTELKVVSGLPIEDADVIEIEDISNK